MRQENKRGMGECINRSSMARKKRKHFLLMKQKNCLLKSGKDRRENE